MGESQGTGIWGLGMGKGEGMGPGNGGGSRDRGGWVGGGGECTNHKQ